MANFNISYLIELRDKYTANADKLARMNKRLQASFRLVRMKLNKLSRDLKAFGDRVKKVGRDLSLGLSLPLATAFTFAIKKAGDAQEVFNKFNEVFKSVKKEANDVARTFAKTFELSDLKAKQLLGTTGDIVKGFGFTGKQALEMSKQVNTLAMDMASFKDVSQERASEALTKALLGEREMLKMLGTAITEDIVKQELASMGMAKLTGTALRQAKAIATLRLAYRMNKDAIGDYQRTKESFNNSLKRFANLTEQASVNLGTLLLPYANKLLNLTISLVKKINDLSTPMKQMILFFGALAIVIPPVLFVIGTLASAIGAIGIVTAGWIAGGVALAGVLGVLYAKSDTFRAVVQAIWSVLKGFGVIIAVIGKLLWDYLIKYIVMAVGWFIKWLTPIGLVTQAIMFLIEKMGGLKAIAEGIGGFFNKVSDFGINILTGGKKGDVVQGSDVANNKTSVDGNITVKAEQGTQVTGTSMKTKGSKSNLGMNRATAGKV